MSVTVASEEQGELEHLKTAIWCVLQEVGSFDVLDEDLVPEGLKPVARSISWLVEQVVVQNLRVRGPKCGIEEVLDPPHGLGQYDCEIALSAIDTRFKVNVKTSLTTTRHSSRFDISKAEKLIKLYVDDPDLTLVVVIVKVRLENTLVTFDDLIAFDVAKTPDIYYNRANHNLQSKSDGSMTERSNEEFVDLLRQAMDAAGHTDHY